MRQNTNQHYIKHKNQQINNKLKKMAIQHYVERQDVIYTLLNLSKPSIQRQPVTWIPHDGETLILLTLLSSTMLF